jgi:chromosome partitioning protein
MVVSIVNHKGGTGKTTTTINLGSALAAQGNKVLLVDFDAQGSLTYSLNIINAGRSIANALQGEFPVREILQERESMHILPANAALADVELAIASAADRFNHLKDLLSQLPKYDFVLIDCPPSLSLLTLNALVASDQIIVPMQLDVLALRGLDSMLETLEKVSVLNPRVEVLGILPVMVDLRKNIQVEILSHIKNNYAVPLLKQAIHVSVKAAEAPSFGKSVISYAPSSTVANDYRELAKEVLTLTEIIQP